ncbi:MAG: hypothetical protein AOA65_0088 [Candidatus Bathyarchaeota archaeon BA1]|nr:MAG: hypothetical protein AOA65_0088 [Candidatus Bathyarchaeota archaeon BA1]
MGFHKGIIKVICGRLLKCDLNIVEIIQFGSSIYASKHAKDVDLLIITKRKMPHIEYLDTIYQEDLPFDVDVSVFELNEQMGEGFLRNVVGAYHVLYGTGEHLKRLSEKLSDPTFEEARSYLRGAKEDMELAERASNPHDKDRRVRSAFNNLFHAARIASMTYLSTETTRWGRIKRQLLSPYKKRFDNYITILHIKYFYVGDYPKNGLKEEFNKWSKEVEGYINTLETETIKKIHTGT